MTGAGPPCLYYFWIVVNLFFGDGDLQLVFFAGRGGVLFALLLFSSG
jgi:hypothetical protein